MRALKFNDVYKMATILKKTKIKDQLNVEGMTQDEAGREFVFLIIENIPNAKEEINDFFGELNGMTGEEFGELEFDKVFDLVEEFISQPGLKNFFKSASRLMK